MSDRFHLPGGYVANEHPDYYHDVDQSVTWQPEVYELACMAGAALGCTTLVDVGCGSARKSAAFAGDVVLIDHGPNLPDGALDQDLEHGLYLPGDINLASSVIVCADVIEHLCDPTGLLQAFADLSRRVPLLLISTPDRDLVRPAGDLGPPANTCHVREWTRREFAGMLTGFGIAADVGYTIDNDRDRRPYTLLARCGTGR